MVGVAFCEQVFADSGSNFWDRFTEVNELGKGAFAVCSLCKDKVNEQLFAVKKISKGKLPFRYFAYSTVLTRVGYI